MLTFELLVWYDNGIKDGGYTRYLNGLDGGNPTNSDERHECITEAWLFRKIEYLAADLRNPCFTLLNFKINNRMRIANVARMSEDWRFALNHSTDTHLEFDER